MGIPLVTLTTDFGHGSPYGAALKGSLLRVAPQARVLDLTDVIGPQNIPQAAWFLKHSLPWFPKNTLHIVVVDPGVGGSRNLLFIEGLGQKILAPDNGCWTLFLPNPEKVICLQEKQWWNGEVSATFHGRDILAPVAGHLVNGVSAKELGPVVGNWVKLQPPAVVKTDQGWQGEVAWVDSFGNLLTNLKFAELPARGFCLINGQELRNRCTHYSELSPGEFAFLQSSEGYLEIAVVNGSASRVLSALPGNPVSFIEVQP